MLGLQPLYSNPHPALREVWLIRVNLCQHAMYDPAHKPLLDTADCQESLNRKPLFWDLGSLCY